MTLEQFLDVMIRDKKNVAGKIRLVLLKALGEAVVTEQVASELLQAAISNHIASFSTNHRNNISNSF